MHIANPVFRSLRRSTHLYNHYASYSRLLYSTDSSSHASTSQKPVSNQALSITPPPPELQRAIDDLNSIPELKEALSTADASLRQTLLSRIFDILNPPPSPTKPASASTSGSPHAIVAHTLLARQAYITGDVPTERTHRIHALHHLPNLKIKDDEEEIALRSAIAAANISLSLCCLRSFGPEMKLAADAAASTAETLSTHSRMKLCSALLSGLSAGSNQKRTMLLTALTAMDNDKSDQPDCAGFARYFLATDALRNHDNSTAIDQSSSLIVRWDPSSNPDVQISTYDFVEALVLAANSCMTDSNKFDQAEDFLTRAIKATENAGGNTADKAEPLLTFAKLYRKQNFTIQAEGMLRAVEDAFEPMWKQKAFTVASAHVYVRVLEEFADMLDTVTVDGKGRQTEVKEKRKRAEEIRALFPYVLPNEAQGEANGSLHTPPWFVDSIITNFDLPLPI